MICGLLIGLIVGGFVAIFVYIACSLYPPAIMMENESAIGGLSRSWAITKGYRLSLFGAILIAVILAVITGLNYFGKPISRTMWLVLFILSAVALVLILLAYLHF